jgi:hypothetical protein
MTYIKGKNPMSTSPKTQRLRSEDGISTLSTIIGSIIGAIVLAGFAMFYFSAMHGADTSQKHTVAEANSVKVVNRFNRDVAEGRSIEYAGANDVVIEATKVVNKKTTYSRTRYTAKSDGTVVRQVDSVVDGNTAYVQPAGNALWTGSDIKTTTEARDVVFSKFKFTYLSSTGEDLGYPTDAATEDKINRVDIDYFQKTKKGEVNLNTGAALNTLVGSTGTNPAGGPDAVDDNSTANVGYSTSVPVLLNDDFDGTGTIALVGSAPSGVTTKVTSDGKQVNVFIQSGYTGASTFTLQYSLTDSTGKTDTASIKVTVTTLTPVEADDPTFTVTSCPSVTGTVTIPATNSSAVQYLINGANTTTGAKSGYAGGTTIRVTAVAKSGYQLTPDTDGAANDYTLNGGTAVWDDFVVPSISCVTPPTPTFDDSCPDTYTIPATTPVNSYTYSVWAPSSVTRAAGTYPATPTMTTFKAAAGPGYQFTPDAAYTLSNNNTTATYLTDITATSGSHNFGATPCLDLDAFVTNGTSATADAICTPTSAAWTTANIANGGACGVTGVNFVGVPAGTKIMGQRVVDGNEVAAGTGAPAAAAFTVFTSTDTNEKTVYGKVGLSTRYNFWIDNNNNAVADSGEVSYNSDQYPSVPGVSANGSDPDGDKSPNVASATAASLGTNAVKWRSGSTSTATDVRVWSEYVDGDGSTVFGRSASNSTPLKDVCAIGTGCATSTVATGSTAATGTYFDTSAPRGSERFYEAIAYTKCFRTLADAKASVSSNCASFNFDPTVRVGTDPYDASASTGTLQSTVRPAYQAPDTTVTDLTFGKANADACTDSAIVTSVDGTSNNNGLYDCLTNQSDVAYSSINSDHYNKSTGYGPFCAVAPAATADCTLKAVRDPADSDIAVSTSWHPASALTWPAAASSWNQVDTWHLYNCNEGGCNTAPADRVVRSFPGKFQTFAWVQDPDDRYDKYHSYWKPDCWDNTDCVYGANAYGALNWSDSSGLTRGGDYGYKAPSVGLLGGTTHPINNGAWEFRAATSSYSAKEGLWPQTDYDWEVIARGRDNVLRRWATSGNAVNPLRTRIFSAPLPTAISQDSGFCQPADNDNGWKYGFWFKRSQAKPDANAWATENVTFDSMNWSGQTPLSERGKGGWVGAAAASEWMQPTNNPSTWTLPANWASSTHYHTMYTNQDNDGGWTKSLSGGNDADKRIPAVGVSNAGSGWEGVGHTRIETKMTDAAAGYPDFGDRTYWDGGRDAANAYANTYGSSYGSGQASQSRLFRVNAITGADLGADCKGNSLSDAEYSTLDFAGDTSHGYRAIDLGMVTTRKMARKTDGSSYGGWGMQEGNPGTYKWGEID